MGNWEGLARRLFYSQRGSDEQYELIPNEDGLPTRRTSSSPRRQQQQQQNPLRPRSPRELCYACIHVLTPRRVFTFVTSVFAFLVLGVLWSGIPPTYENIREFERRLPQHNVSLPFPEGENGMYLRFPDHLWGHGLNNILQEL